MLNYIKVPEILIDIQELNFVCFSFYPSNINEIKKRQHYMYIIIGTVWNIAFILVFYYYPGDLRNIVKATSDLKSTV